MENPELQKMKTGLITQGSLMIKPKIAIIVKVHNGQVKVKTSF
jgi:hypothetical protein